MIGRFLASLLFATRWLLAPIYLGLSLTLLVVVVKFFQEIIHLFPKITSIPETELVLMILSLIDLALLASLVVMVMLSGYENFVSRFDKSDKLGWLGKLDANSLKLKVAVSIVAISSIHLLQAFMDSPDIANDKLLWYVIMHLTFVASAVAMGLLDKAMRK